MYLNIYVIISVIFVNLHPVPGLFHYFGQDAYVAGALCHVFAQLIKKRLKVFIRLCGCLSGYLRYVHDLLDCGLVIRRRVGVVADDVCSTLIYADPDIIPGLAGDGHLDRGLLNASFDVDPRCAAFHSCDPRCRVVGRSGSFICILYGLYEISDITVHRKPRLFCIRKTALYPAISPCICRLSRSRDNLPLSDPPA